MRLLGGSRVAEPDLGQEFGQDTFGMLSALATFRSYTQLSPDLTDILAPVTAQISNLVFCDLAANTNVHQ